MTLTSPSVDTFTRAVPGCTHISFTSKAFRSCGLMPEKRPQSVRTKFWRSTRGAVHTHSWPESSLERVPIFNPAVWYRLLPTNKNGVTCSNASAWSMCTFIRRLTFWNLDRLPRLRPASLAQRQSLRKIALKRQNRASPVGRTWIAWLAIV